MSEGSGSSSALTIFLVLAGIFVLMILVCGGLVYMGFQAMKPMAEMAKGMVEDMRNSGVAAESFLADIKADRLDAAYNATTAAFKTRMLRPQFDELIKKQPALKQPHQTLGMDMNQAGNQAQPFPMGVFRYRYRTAGEKPLEFTISVVKEDNALKVDQFTVFQAVSP